MTIRVSGAIALLLLTVAPLSGLVRAESRFHASIRLAGALAIAAWNLLRGSFGAPSPITSSPGRAADARPRHDANRRGSYLAKGARKASASPVQVPMLPSKTTGKFE